MTWKKPDFEEIALCMEVTAYMNTEDELPLPVGGEHSRPTNQAAFDEPPAE
ncbi:MAG: pyrroloquinoline quinone precursor peptide PqqA [Planctomycetes bacterium]|nr:pyrroloquinoline quinone precursor peptide PqqA [Planctomycetota bacterium]